MSEIETIRFDNKPPEFYDECWVASVDEGGDIIGYRDGTDVIIAGDKIYANPRCSYMFAGESSYGESLWSSLIEISGLEHLDTSCVTNMKMMFAFTRVSEISGIENWDVSNVVNFAGMFQGHSHVGDTPITHIDIGKWDTSSAENMSHVFYGCSQLNYIPIENWDVSKVKTVSHMFADCFNLQSIDVSKWDTSSVESFDGFLNDCRSLKIIDVSNLKTDVCKQFSQMFEACVSLEEIIGIENWNVSSANHYAFTEMFHECRKLRKLNIGSWTASPDSTARMFKNCYSLSDVDLSGIDMSSVISRDEMFDGSNITYPYS